MIKVKAPFIGEISGLAIIKIHMQCSNIRHSKNGTETIIFKQEEMIGIVDLRSLGYYKIKQGILQQNLNIY